MPWTLVRRGVKKQVITPFGAPQAFLAKAKRERVADEEVQESALMRALGLAHHWQRLLDEGRFASLSEIAAAEGLVLSHASRIARLTLLAPSIVMASLDGRRDAPTLDRLMRAKFAHEWAWQEKALLGASEEKCK
nr:hypothetical protein [Sulfurivermis fontis]